MATNLVFTSTFTGPSGWYSRSSIEGALAANKLDTAGDVTSALNSEGFGQHDWIGNLASVGTSVVVAIEIRNSTSGAWVEVATSTLTANGGFRIGFTGFAVQSRLKIKTITGGTPEINTISGVSYNRYR